MSASSTPVNAFVIEPISNRLEASGAAPSADHPAHSRPPRPPTPAARARWPRCPSSSSRRPSSASIAGPYASVRFAAHVPLGGVFREPDPAGGVALRHEVLARGAEPAATGRGAQPNADGFGLAGTAIGRSRACTAAWRPRGAIATCASWPGRSRRRLFLAHVRAATGTPVEQSNCHPFRHGRWLFVHNGFIDGYARLRRDLLLAVDPELFRGIQGTTDSELLFHLALTFGLEEEPLRPSSAWPASSRRSVTGTMSPSRCR